MSTGLFLTPGAARTAYQVGAVRALVEEGGLRFDVIAASSVGALNGALTATGRTDRLVELWSNWRNRDVFRVDWRALVRGGVLWSPNLMHNRPQRQAFEPYVADDALAEGSRFRINLANLTTGVDDIVEWPGASITMADGVDASVAVPAAIRPHEIDGSQYADGLTVDGFPLERLLLSTGVDRAFVVGVTPLASRSDRPAGPIAALLAAAEWNQYTEVSRGLEAAEQVDARARRWEAARRAALAGVDDLDRAAQIDAAFARHRHGRRGPVDIVPIMPADHIRMFFTTYRPERSRRLIEQGRRDALAVLEALADRD